VCVNGGANRRQRLEEGNTVQQPVATWPAHLWI